MKKKKYINIEKKEQGIGELCQDQAVKGRLSLPIKSHSHILRVHYNFDIVNQTEY